MIDSLKDALNRLPYFLNKEESSNTHKHTLITNNSLINLKNNIQKLIESRLIIKPIWIYKEQTTSFNYTIHFHAGIDEIKTIKIEKILNNISTIVYEQVYNDNNINEFNYSLSDTSETIIPTEKYRLTITTFNEFTYVKGFSENDSIENNEFDHDESLDKIGLFLDIPRKTYITVPPEKYAQTEPFYNNKTTEDDYHYMQRLKYFLENFHKVPLPVLDIGLFFGIKNNVSFENREKKLVKMCRDRFDGVCTPELIQNDKCYFGELPISDSPLEWEHRNLMYVEKDTSDIFVEIVPNTFNPTTEQNVLFKIILRNSIGKIVTTNFTIVPYLKDSNNKFKALLTNITTGDYVLIEGKNNWLLNYNYLDTTAINVFKFKIFNNNAEALEELGETGLLVEAGTITEDINIQVITCSDADNFVSETGSDITGDGSFNNPYLTINKAVAESNNGDLIVIMEGTVDVLTTVQIDKNLTIMGCPNTNTIISTNLEHIFSIGQGIMLILNNVSIMNGESEYNINSSFSVFNQSNNNHSSFVLSNTERSNTEHLYPDDRADFALADYART